MSYIKNAAQQYKELNTQSAAAYADPHQLITMLFEGAVERIAAAKGAMANKDIATKGSLISKAILIVDALRAYLDMEKGGEIAVNLRNLYDYMERRLFEANMENDEAMLDEVSGLIQTLKSGWVQIEPKNKDETAPLDASSGFSVQG